MRKDIYFLIFSQLTVLLSGFIFNKLVSVYFDKDIVGEYFYLISIVNFLSLFFVSPVIQYFTRLYVDDKKESFKVFWFCSIWVFPLVALFLITLASKLELSQFNIFIVLLTTISQAISFLISSVINLDLRRDRLMALAVLSAVIKVGCLLCLILLNVFEPSLLLLSTAIAFLGALYFFRADYFVIGKNVDFPSLISFTFPLVLTSILSWSKDNVFRSFSAFDGNLELAAEISFLNAVSMILPFALLSVMNSYVNGKYLRDGNYQFVLKCAKYMAAVFTIALPIFYFLSEYLVIIFLDKKYLNISGYIWIFFVGHCLFSVATIINYKCFYEKRLKMLLVPSLSSSTILLSFYFLEKNIENASFCFLLSMVVFLTISMVINLRCYTK